MLSVQLFALTYLARVIQIVALDGPNAIYRTSGDVDAVVHLGHPWMTTNMPKIGDYVIQEKGLEPERVRRQVFESRHINVELTEPGTATYETVEDTPTEGLVDDLSDNSQTDPPFTPETSGPDTGVVDDFIGDTPEVADTPEVSGETQTLTSDDVGDIEDLGLFDESA